VLIVVKLAAIGQLLEKLQFGFVGVPIFIHQSSVNSGGRLRMPLVGSRSNLGSALLLLFI
jgi:hypothetical protein